MRSPSTPIPPDLTLQAPRTPAPQVQPFQEQFIPSPTSRSQWSDSESKPTNMSRARASSNVRPVLHQPQPIRTAVEEAFDQSIDQSPSSAISQLDPAFIAQVTEAVVKSLQSANLSQATPTPSTAPQPQQQQAHYPPPPPPSSQNVPRSPTQSSTTSFAPRQTPPSSPDREPRARQDSIDSYDSTSPPPSDSGSAFSRHSSYSMRSRGSARDEETPRPTPMETGNVNGTRRSNTTAQRRGDASRVRSRRGSGSDTTQTTRPFRRDSADSQASTGRYDGPSSRSRVRPARIPSDVEETTTLEKIWQPLFDNGNPTVRLGQFLRGLAIHLIEDYEPKSSLVVTPAKMLRFFEETRLTDELYPWPTIFGGKMSMPSLSIMYRRLLCQHHLVQVQNHEIPTVPGLTPAGFEWFLTCLIQAHPDTEYDRLAMAVMNMPISNADNKTERFPKELSRRLLPAMPNSQAEQRLIASLAHESELIQLRNSHTMPPPPSSAPPPHASFKERERKPYAQSSFSNAVEDDDLSVPPSMPIERERKPYSAKEGSGKTHEPDEGREDQSRPSTSQYKPDGGVDIPSRPTRANSSQPMSYGASNGTPADSRPIPPPNRHRMSMGQGTAPGMLNGNGFSKGSNSGRRSPPPMNTFARSAPMGVNDIQGVEYGSNLHPGFADGVDQDNLRRYHNRSRTATGSGGNNGSQDEENGRGKPIPRPSPSSSRNYEPEYNPGPPVGSYPARPRQRPGAPDYDDRRRSMYVGSMPAGGTDGYGSFAGNGGQYPYGSSVQH